MSSDLEGKLNQLKVNIDYENFLEAESLILELRESVGEKDYIDFQILEAKYFLEIRQLNKAREYFDNLESGATKLSRVQKAELTSLTTQLFIYQEEFDLAESTINQISKLIEVLNPNDERRQWLESDILQYKAIIETFRENFETANQHIQTAKNLMQKLNRQFRLSKLAILENDILQLENKDSPEQTKTKISEQMEAESEKMSKLLVQVSTLETQKNAATELNEELEEQVKRLNQENEELKSQVSELQNEDVQKMKDEIIELKNTIDRQSFELDNKISEIKNLRRELTKELTKSKETKEKLTPDLPQNQTSKLDIQTTGKQLSNPLLAGASIKKEEIISDRSLSDLIAADIVVENVYERMKNSEETKIRILAMQLGINQKKCEEAIKKLVNLKVLIYGDSDTVLFAG